MLFDHAVRILHHLESALDRLRRIVLSLHNLGFLVIKQLFIIVWLLPAPRNSICIESHPSFVVGREIICPLHWNIIVRLLDFAQRYYRYDSLVCVVEVVACACLLIWVVVPKVLLAVWIVQSALRWDFVHNLCSIVVLDLLVSSTAHWSIASLRVAVWID